MDGQPLAPGVRAREERTRGFSEDILTIEGSLWFDGDDEDEDFVEGEDAEKDSEDDADADEE